MRSLLILLPLVLAAALAPVSSIAHTGDAATEAHATAASDCCHLPGGSPADASGAHAHTCSPGCAVLAVAPGMSHGQGRSYRVAIAPALYLSPAFDRSHRPPIPRS